MVRSSKHPKTDSDTTSAGKGKVAWRGYVNYTVTESDKKLLKAALENGWNTDESLEEVLLDGYKLSVTYDNYRSAFCATLYCQAADDSNAGWALTARANNTNAAVVRVLHIHCNVLHRQWDRSVEVQREADEW